MRRRVNEIVQEVNWWPLASLNGQLKLLFAISDNDFWTTLININQWLRSVSAAWTKKKKFLDNKKTKFISVFSAWIGIIKLCYKFRAVARAEANDSICVCVFMPSLQLVHPVNFTRSISSSFVNLNFAFDFCRTKKKWKNEINCGARRALRLWAEAACECLVCCCLCYEINFSESSFYGKYWRNKHARLAH